MISEDDFYRARDDLQDLIDRYVEEVETLGKRKAQDLLEA